MTGKNRSNSLTAGEELVTGSKVPSDLLQLEIKTLRELGLHNNHNNNDNKTFVKVSGSI